MRYCRDSDGILRIRISPTEAPTMSYEGSNIPSPDAKRAGVTVTYQVTCTGSHGYARDVVKYANIELARIGIMSKVTGPENATVLEICGHDGNAYNLEWHAVLVPREMKQTGS